MFVFGDPEQMAQFYIDSAMGIKGPKVPEVPFDDLGEAEQKAAFTYIYIAYRTALMDSADDAVVELLRDFYDKLFVQLAQAQPSFVEAVRSYRHVFLPSHEKDNINKYRVLAGVPPLP